MVSFVNNIAISLLLTWSHSTSSNKEVENKNLINLIKPDLLDLWVFNWVHNKCTIAYLPLIFLH